MDDITNIFMIYDTMCENVKTAPTPVRTPTKPSIKPRPQHPLRPTPGPAPKPKGILKKCADRCENEEIDINNNNKEVLAFLQRRDLSIKEAFDPGEHDFVHQDIKDSIDADNWQISKILPQLSADEQTYLQIITSKQYQNVSSKINNILTTSDSYQNLPSLLFSVYSIIDKVIDIESDHKEDLEFICKNVVLDLPEFQSMREMVYDGTIILDVRLGKPNLDNVVFDDHDNDDEHNTIDLQSDEIDNLIIFDALDEDGLDPLILKRRLANTMIAGNATHKSMLYKLIENEIKQFDERLPEMYGIIMTVTDFSFWITPPDLLDNMGDVAKDAALGSSEMEFGDSDTLKAYGLIFPVLTHELTKSLMEYVSYGALPTDNVVRQHVIDRVDKINNEPQDLMSGPELWKQFTKLVPINDQNVLMNVYQKFLQLDMKSIKEVLSQSSAGMRIIKQLINDSKQDMEDYENPEYTDT